MPVIALFIIFLANRLYPLKPFQTMKDYANTPPSELIEIERLICELISDARHPVNDRRHPQHHEYLKALNDLMGHADSLRNDWLIH